jgi:hypothetical protein
MRRAENTKLTTTGIKTEDLAVGIACIENGEGGRQSRMAAEVDFHAGREPTQIIQTTAPANIEGSFRHIVFAGDRLKRAVRQPAVELTDGSRISAENLAAERIDLLDFQFQAHLPRIVRVDNGRSGFPQGRDPDPTKAAMSPGMRARRGPLLPT